MNKDKIPEEFESIEQIQDFWVDFRTYFSLKNDLCKLEFFLMVE